MFPDVDVSVVIPSHGRAQKLRRCLAALTPPRNAGVEVLVGLDGGMPEEARALEAAQWPLAVRALAFPKRGPGPVRDALLGESRGRLVLMLNDDVVPGPGLIEAHLKAHEELNGRGAGVMVVGAAPFVTPPTTRVLDVLLRETGMVFFYGEMDRLLARGEVTRDHDWGFRHAWTLNASVRREAIIGAGGFAPGLALPAFEDLELAWRIAQWSAGRGEAGGVIYRPEARVLHDHVMTAQAYLDRERMLGKAAWALAGANPQCAKAIFRRDLRLEETQRAMEAWVERSRGDVTKVRETFLTLMEQDAALVDDERLVRVLYEHHLMLKRWTFDLGVLDAARENATGDGTMGLEAGRDAA